LFENIGCFADLLFAPFWFKVVKSNDQVVRELSSIIGHNDDFETEIELESQFRNLIALE